MTTTSSPVLSVRDLRVATTGPRPDEILKGISFDINPGEVVCLVGESGSGKSVTSLVTMDLLPEQELRATGGEVLLNGEDILRATPARTKALRGAEMAMIFQEPMTALNPVLRIGLQMEEVYMAHRDMSARDRRAAVLEAFASVQLPDPPRIYDSYPHQLSGGQRQRVMIAMALANGPDLLIADEPTTALDVTIQAQILDLLMGLKDTLGMSLLFITHDLTVVRKIADRVCVMKDGEIVETGVTRDIFDNPQHPYTIKLLGAEPSGRPDPVAPDAEVIASTDHLKVWFPIQKGFMRKTVDHVKAVNDASLSVRAGETLGIVGESGSGKSVSALSTVQLLGDNAHLEGSVSFKGTQMIGAPEADLRRVRGNDISFIFQEPMTSLNPLHTLEKQLAESLALHQGVAGAEARARILELLDKVGIVDAESRLGAYPHQLSGGQRQRVMIAMALANKPELLIADEPTTALDVTIQAQILDLLARLRAEMNMAIVFISHDLGAVAQVCERVCVMYAGRIVEQGAVGLLFERPRHPYTRGLFDAIPRLHGPRTPLVPIPGTVPDPRNLPKGCAFQPRCAHARGFCQSERPDLLAQKDGRKLACAFPLPESSEEAEREVRREGMLQ